MSQEVEARLRSRTRLQMGAMATCLIAAFCRAAAAEPSAPDGSGPEREQEFLQIILDARNQLATSHMRIQDVRIVMQMRLETFWESDPTMKGWTGTVESSGVTQEGEGWVVLSIAPDVTIGTPRTHVADAQHTSLIAPRSPLLPIVMKLTTGDEVIFDGSLVRYVVWSDDAMIAHPQILAHFDKIARLAD